MLDIVSTVPDEEGLLKFESVVWRVRGNEVVMPNPTISKHLYKEEYARGYAISFGVSEVWRCFLIAL